MKSCFFIGHREVYTEILPALTEVVERHIVEYGVTEFIVGNYGGFDHMAARAVIAAKERHPGITLFMLIPYHPAERPVDLQQGFDNTFYPPGMEKVPRRLAIVRANRYMVDHVDYLIAYAWHPASNARELVAYAERRASRGKIVVTNIVGSDVSSIIYNKIGEASQSLTPPNSQKTVTISGNRLLQFGISITGK